MELALNLPVVHPAATAAVLGDLAEHAEELGYAALYLGEHVVLFDAPDDDYPGSESGEAFFPAGASLPEPLTLHAYLAGRTERIRLATGVMLVPQRNPVYTAKHVATLDWLSGGRLDLGVGVGWSSEEYAACAVPFARRADRLVEYLALMRRLWEDPLSEFSGEFYELPRCRQYPKPIQSPMPLWFGGWVESALVRAAALADGWYGFDLAPDEIAGIVRRIRELLAEQGRAPGAVRIATGAYTRMPPAGADIAALEEIGVERFAVSLTAPDVAGLHAELAELARLSSRSSRSS
jgi:probable F420-dependent oxidoreductase